MPAIYPWLTLKKDELHGFRKILLFVILVAIMLTAICLQRADASEQEAPARQAFGPVYRTIRTIAMAMGVVGIAASAVQIVMGDTQTASKAKTRLFLIVLAVMAVWVLPIVISSGSTLFGAGWNPNNPG